MAVSPFNITMLRGDTPSLNLTITTDGSATNLTGSTLRMTAKYNADDADGSAVFTKTSPSSGITITNATGGLATVLLAKTDTSTLPAQQVNLYYDIQLTDSATPANVYTIAWGRLYVLPDISVTTP